MNDNHPRIITLDEIVGLCKRYARSRERLAKTVEKIRDRQRKVVNTHMRGLKNRVAEVSAAREALHDAVSDAPELFVKPRTRAIDGVKVGYRKKPGALEYDEARTIVRIREQLPDKAESLIKVTEKVIAAAVKSLDSRTLSKIGVTVVDVDDEVVISVSSSDIDKLVDTLLADEPEDV